MNASPTTKTLLQDKVFLGALIVLLLVLIPYVFPVLNEDQRWWWDAVFVNLILYGTALAMVLIGLRSIPSRRERRFWRFLGLAMGSIVALYVVWAIAERFFTDTFAQSQVIELLSQASYLVFYLAFALGLDDSRPIWEGSLAHELRWVRRAGLGTLVAGLILYFVTAPAMVVPGDAVDWTAILFIYASLDTLLCLEFLRARARTTNPRWRSILGWTALGLGSWAVVDFAEALMALDWLQWLGQGGLFDLQWYAPILVFAAGARLHIGNPPSVDSTPETEQRLLSGGPLIAYGAALPLVHFGLYGLDVLDPELRALREVIVLPVMVFIGMLTALYQGSVERQNRSTHHELQRSRERYRSFVESSVEGIWRLGFDPPVSADEPEDVQMARIFRQGHVIESNDAMATMYGFESASDSEGRRLGLILRSVKDHDVNVGSMLRFIRSGYRVIRAPLKFVAADGSLRHFEGSMVGVVEDGALVGAWATQVDVTPRYEVEAAKEKLEHQLRRTQRLETIGTLAGGIAHDFNNMLSPILGFTELAEESLPPSAAKTRGYLQQVKGGATRAKALVNQILAVGRHQDSDREAVDVTRVVDEAVALLRQSLPSYIAFHKDYAPGCPPVLADSGQLHQVVMNLCTNARQAIGERPGAVWVRVDTVQVGATPEGPPVGPGSYVRLSVEDDGAGMSPKTLDRAFEAFYTTKPLGKGSGLGLSVSHGIVESHEGHIDIESEEGRGATVTVYLPATQAMAQDSMGPSEEVRAEVAEARVMLVDDDDAVAALGEVMLQGLGCDVMTFTDSRQAREILGQKPFDFDLLVTDHTMPGLTGPQLAAYARSLNPGLAVVIASGYRLVPDEDSGDDFTHLEKPFSTGELRAAAASALELVRTD